MRTEQLQRPLNKKQRPAASASYHDMEHTEQHTTAVAVLVYSFPPGQATSCFYKISRSVTVFTNSSMYPDLDQSSPFLHPQFFLNPL
jgi:hypothetical protein